MGLKDRMAETNELIRQHLTAHVGGEQLDGSGYATWRKSAFKNQMVLFGVTPSRLVLLEADRRMQPTGQPIELTPGDITASSIDGFGGGVKHVFNDGEVWIDTAQHGRIKLSVIANGVVERAMLGKDSLSGTDVLCEWLVNARGR